MAYNPYSAVNAIYKLKVSGTVQIRQAMKQKRTKPHRKHRNTINN